MKPKMYGFFQQTNDLKKSFINLRNFFIKIQISLEIIT